VGILSTDTCQRADQSGLGTASDGETYTVNGGLTTSIVSNEAQITNSSGFTSVILGTQTTTDINFLVRLTQINSLYDGIGPCFRSDATGQNCYFVARYAGVGGLLFAKLTGGSYSGIASGNFALNTSVFTWIRVVMAGNHLQTRIWDDGQSEPSTWLIDTTDNSYTAAGRYGLLFNGFGSDIVTFDSITVTDNQSAPPATAITSVVAIARDGQVKAFTRDGLVTSYGRDGIVTARSH
jgi:hypothetical protein